jgi:hypothetical protein
MIKTYFNGVTDATPPCAYVTSGTQNVSHPVLLADFSTTIKVAPIKQEPDPAALNCMQTLLCNAPAVGGGNNARLAATGIDDKDVVNDLAFVAFPNPVSSSEILKVNLESNGNKTVHVQLINLLGQVILSTEKQLVAGENTLELQMPADAKGLHTLSIRGEAFSKSALISVR